MDKVIGLDLGKKTCGIACSDSLGIPHGIETYHFKAFDYVSCADYVDAFAKSRGVKEFALGMPYHKSGDISMMAENVLSFKKLLEAKDKEYIINLVDERFSSVIANKTISTLDLSHQKRKEVVDTIAACEILDTYLRQKGNK